MDATKPVGVLDSTYNKFKDKAVDGGWPPVTGRVGDRFAGTFDVEDLACGL